MIWNDDTEKTTGISREQKYGISKITYIDIVRCKNCINRGKAEKCVLAAISKEKNYPVFILDNRGEWFCADGKRN